MQPDSADAGKRDIVIPAKAGIQGVGARGPIRDVQPLMLGVISRFTIFEYGAPESDVEAVELMSKAWGTPESRELEQVEIIDIQREDVVKKRWNRFILSHHYDYFTRYFQSVLSQFPRRTGERFMHPFLPSTIRAFQESNPVSARFDTLTTPSMNGRTSRIGPRGPTPWIPAFAGMTMSHIVDGPTRAYALDSGFRRNDDVAHFLLVERPARGGP